MAIPVTKSISMPVTTRTLGAIKCFDNDYVEPNLALPFVKTQVSLSGSVVFPYTKSTDVSSSGPTSQTYWITG